MHSVGETETMSTKSFGNHKADSYDDLVQDMFHNVRRCGCVHVGPWAFLCDFVYNLLRCHINAAD